MPAHDPLVRIHPSPPVSRRPRRPPSRVVVRRRLAAAAVAAGTLVAGGAGVVAVLGSGDVPASAAGAQHLAVRRSVVAAPGDSLWTIAERHHDRGADSMGVQEYVDLLVELNGGAAIDVGQRVVLP